MDYNEIFNSSYDRITCRFFDQFFDCLYASLSAKSNEVNQLVQTIDMGDQKHTIKKMLVMMVYFSSVKVADAELERIARLHCSLGIKKHYFNLWLDALIEAVAAIDPYYKENDGAAWRIVMSPSIEFMKSYVPD